MSHLLAAAWKQTLAGAELFAGRKLRLEAGLSFNLLRERFLRSRAAFAGTDVPRAPFADADVACRSIRRNSGNSMIHRPRARTDRGSSFSRGEGGGYTRSLSSEHVVQVDHATVVQACAGVWLGGNLSKWNRYWACVCMCCAILVAKCRTCCSEKNLIY